MSEAALKGLVLAGGRSRRMGSDKALLRHGDDSQLGFAMRLLADCVGDAYVSTRPDQVDEPERARFPQIVDRFEDLGPVAGILSAMATEPTAAWLVLACDLPNVSRELIDTLIAARDPARPFTAYRSSHNELPEPLCAIYEPAAAAVIEAFVADDIRCPRKMMIRSDTKLIAQPAADALDNINTPDDLARSTLDIAS